MAGRPSNARTMEGRRFLGLVSELPERFGTEIHAFVLMLMDNNYHLWKCNGVKHRYLTIIGKCNGVKHRYLTIIAGSGSVVAGRGN